MLLAKTDYKTTKSECSATQFYLHKYGTANILSKHVQNLSNDS